MSRGGGEFFQSKEGGKRDEKGSFKANKGSESKGEREEENCNTLTLTKQEVEKNLTILSEEELTRRPLLNRRKISMRGGKRIQGELYSARVKSFGGGKRRSEGKGGMAF